MSSLHFSSRLDYSGDFSSLIKRICKVFTIGELVNFEIIEVGYEDCNVLIKTHKGTYVAKIFSKDRSQEEIERYAIIMQKVIQAGVNHPELLRTQDQDVLYHDKNITLVVMPFIEGKTFYTLDRPPNTEELKLITEQASIINAVEYKPPFILDSWAIPNIETSLDRVKPFMMPQDVKLVDDAVSRYKSIPIDKLPHTFVHGDFTKANILKGHDEKMYILDFSVANWYPRIQELAVMAANLLHGAEDTTLRKRCEMTVKQYSKYTQLTHDEEKYLYPYALAGVAMEMIGAHIEKYINGNKSEETEYWLSLGSEGLKQALNNGGSA